MKKVLLIMAAALMTMTQCRKQETVPATPLADTIKMTITAGPGAKTDITNEGAITWTSGDKLYVSDGTKWLGSLTLQSGAGNASGTFTGNISEISDGTTCHFFYLGHDNGMTGATVGENTNAVISFASQDGTRGGALKYHLGHGSADVTVTEGEATGSVIMNTKIAIAHINFTNGTQAYTGSVTMGGTGIFNTLSVNPNGTFSGSSATGITINKDGGYTTGDRYVTLIPTETTDVLSVAFTGDATGSMTFANGIEANKFYGMSNAIEVTVEASTPKFSVANGTTVEFAPGNLYWDGSAFHFEANQWSFANTWNSSHVSHFKWSDAANAVTGNTNYNGDLFCANNFTVAGDSHTWRTLTCDEWNYLLGFDPEQWEQTDEYGRSGAMGLCAWKELDEGTHKGLVILPDGTDASVMNSITKTSDLATHGAVFLPAAGYRVGTDVNDVGSNGYYWSSTPIEDVEGFACNMYFDSGLVYTGNVIRYVGYAVRLVRSAS